MGEEGGSCRWVTNHKKILSVFSSVKINILEKLIIFIFVKYQGFIMAIKSSF